MQILVQKFGGTSVGTPHRIHLAARRAIRAKLDGRQIVLVVSAMGDTTDRLLDLARQISRDPPRRELDLLLATGEQVSIALLAMAIQEAGHDAISLTGAQIGLLTDRRHTEARIRSINAERIRRELDQGRIVIVAGFQGVDPDANITTLGRGGSDTTAVALAAALAAECEIYTDVEGVYSADPRLVPTARKIDAISYDEMLEFAALGAGVMHARSIELGKKFGVALHVRSSMLDAPGTLIMNEAPGMEDVVVRGVTHKPNLARVSLLGLPRRPDLLADLFARVAAQRQVVDDILQTPAPDGQRVNISFSVESSGLAAAQAVAELLAARYAGASYEMLDDLTKISVVGIGMRSHSGVAARVFAALAAAGIGIESISTSEIVISVLVRSADAQRGLATIHDAFAAGDGSDA